MASTADCLDWISAQQERATLLLQELAQVNTYSRNLTGLAEAADRLVGLFSNVADEVRLVETQPRTGPDGKVEFGKVIRAVRRAHVRPRALLSIHYDTVYPPETSQPVRLEGSTLHGPGVLDAKGGLITLWLAVQALERWEGAQQLGWEILLNPDEEVGSPGSAHVLEQSARESDFGLVFEPAAADGSLVGARKGTGNFSAHFHGKAAHAGREIHLGRNAVCAGAHFAVLVEEASRTLTEGITINISRIEGGGPTNVVPDFAAVKLNARVTEAAQQDEVKTMLRETLHLVERQRDGIRGELQGAFHSPPRVIDDRARRFYDLAIESARTLGMNLSVASSGGASDANKLASTGLLTLDGLGPCGSGMHSPAERVDLPSIVQRAKLAFHILTRLGGFRPV
jgi:glutamate carboxypeptidase